MANLIIVGPISPYRGGIAHFNDSIIKTFISQGHNVKVISWKKRYPSFLYPGESQFDLNKAEYLSSDPRFILNIFNPISWLEARRIITNDNPDILILHWVTPFLSIVLRVLLGAKAKTKVLICHNVLPHERRFGDETLAKMVFQKVDHFIVHAQEEVFKLERIIPFAKSHLGFHPPYSFFVRDNPKWILRDKFNIEKGIHCLLYFGYIRKYKGLKYLIEALAILNLSEPNKYHLFIVGEIWEGQEDLKTQISMFSLETHVTIVDQYVPDEEVSSYFIGCDLAILPYISATQSGVAQIALSFDLPIITTNVGGLKDLDKFGGDVTLVESGNPKAIQEAIVSYFERKIDTYNEQTFSVDRSWDQYVQLIQNTLCI